MHELNDKLAEFETVWSKFMSLPEEVKSPFPISLPNCARAKRKKNRQPIIYLFIYCFSLPNTLFFLAAVNVNWPVSHRLLLFNFKTDHNSRACGFANCGTNQKYLLRPLMHVLFFWMCEHSPCCVPKILS